MNSRVLSSQKKQDFLESFLKEQDLLIKNFIYLLVDKNLCSLMPGIRKMFQRLFK